MNEIDINYDDKVESLLSVVKESIKDLLIHVKMNNEIEKSLNKAEPTPLMSIDEYIRDFKPTDQKLLEPILTPRFEFDYGFNPLIYLADRIEERLLITDKVENQKETDNSIDD